VRRAQVLTLLLLIAAALGACGKDDNRGLGRGHEDTSPPATTATATTTKPVAEPRRTQDGCAPIAAAQPRPDQHLRAPRRKLAHKGRYFATLRTNCGTIRVMLDVRAFPKTTASFAALARAGFYDGLSFHRIAKPGGNDFVIQGGDPQGKGEGGPGYSVVEKPPRSTRYPLGTLAMAKAGDEKAGTSGSQFFIVTGDGAGLDPLYAVVGHVIAGGGVVRRIAAVPADPKTEAPIDPVVIKKLTIGGAKKLKTGRAKR